MKVKNIMRYDSTIRVLDQFPEFALSDDQYDYISGLDDYETFVYNVIDGKKVIITDSTNGDVIDVMTINKFYRDCLKEYDRHMREDLFI